MHQLTEVRKEDEIGGTKKWVEWGDERKEKQKDSQLPVYREHRRQETGQQDSRSQH